MKKFLAILLTITATATTIVLVGLFVIPYVGNEAIKLIANQTIDDSIVDSNDLYQAAEDLGIEQEKIDKALSNEEMKEYVNVIWQEILTKKASNNTSIDEDLIKEKTKEFLEKANKNYDISLDNDKIEELTDNAKLLNIPLDIFETNIFDVVHDIKESPCYLCARMRRGYLYANAKKRGCNKIALGHHFDDVIETVLMSMIYGAEYKTFS